MEVKSKEYKLRGDIFYFRPSARAYIEFEAVAGKSISKMDETLVDSLRFVYACTKAGMHFEKRNFNMSYMEFLDFVDDDLDAIFDVLSDGNVDTEDEKKKQRTLKLMN